MKQINAKFYTFFLKKIFPILFFCILGLALYTFFSPPNGIDFEELTHGSTDIIFLLFPIVMGIVAFLIFKLWIFPMADAVYDEGSFLRIRRGAEEIKLSLAEIDKIYYNSLINPHILTITSQQETTFGKKIKFIPIMAFSFNPFKKHKNIQSLIDRIEQTK